MNTSEMIQKIKGEESTPTFDPPKECVFCCERQSLWNDIVKRAYEKKVGRKIEQTKPCIHHKDSWLTWSMDVAGFICASITNNGEKTLPSHDEIFAILKDKEKIFSLMTALYKKWMVHSSWLRIWSEDMARGGKGLPKKFTFMEDIDKAAEIENKKLRHRTQIQYDNATECINLLHEETL